MLMATVPCRVWLCVDKSYVFSLNVTAPTEISTLSLHDALPISTAVKLEGGRAMVPVVKALVDVGIPVMGHLRSEEHTSELQSRRDLVCRLLLEKKKVHNNSYLDGQLYLEPHPKEHMLGKHV